MPLPLLAQSSFGHCNVSDAHPALEPRLRGLTTDQKHLFELHILTPTRIDTH
jgi:hypothetical protein